VIVDVSTIGLIEDEDILLDLASLALSHLDHDNADIAPYLEKRPKWTRAALPIGGAAAAPYQHPRSAAGQARAKPNPWGQLHAGSAGALIRGCPTFSRNAMWSRPLGTSGFRSDIQFLTSASGRRNAVRAYNREHLAAI
jgi:hypothetical protein